MHIIVFWWKIEVLIIEIQRIGSVGNDNAKTEFGGILGSVKKKEKKKRERKEKKKKKRRMNKRLASLVLWPLIFE